MRHCLVIANQTLGGSALLDAVRSRVERGPLACWVLVPATAGHLINDFNALSCAFPVDPDIAYGATEVAAGQTPDDDATRRLDEGLRRLRALGATAEGAVSDADPLTALDATLAARSFDEIIVSTLPPGASRWLALDLPSRIRRRTRLPLTVVTAADDPG